MTSRSIFPPNCSRIFFSCSRNPIMGPHWKWQRNISMVSDDSPFVAIRNCSFCGFSGDASNLPIKEKQHYSLGQHSNKSHLTIGQLSSIITTIDFFSPSQQRNLIELYVLLFFLSFVGAILPGKRFILKQKYSTFLTDTKHAFQKPGGWKQNVYSKALNFKITQVFFEICWHRYQIHNGYLSKIVWLVLMAKLW